MWESLIEDISVVAVGIYAALALLELTLDLRHKTGHYKLKDSLCSLTMGAFYLGTKFLTKGATLFIMLLASEYALFDIAGGWATFLLVYVIVDLCFYWLHRIIHEVRFGWAAHVNHHSSQEFNLGGTALRQSFAEPLMEPFFYAPVVLLGFDPLMVLAAIEINLIYMYWVHTQKIDKLHPLCEWLLSTPSNHRVHHACNVQYLDRNYGGTFMLWDHLFGTYEREVEKPVFGIPEQINTFNPVKASFHGWIELGRDVWNAPGLFNKIGLLVMPPGWAPGNSGLTTRQRQAAYYRERSGLDAALQTVQGG